MQPSKTIKIVLPSFSSTTRLRELFKAADTRRLKLGTRNRKNPQTARSTTAPPSPACTLPHATSPESKADSMIFARSSHPQTSKSTETDARDSCQPTRTRRLSRFPSFICLLPSLRPVRGEPSLSTRSGCSSSAAGPSPRPRLAEERWFSRPPKLARK